MLRYQAEQSRIQEGWHEEAEEYKGGYASKAACWDGGVITFVNNGLNVCKDDAQVAVTCKSVYLERWARH